MEKISRNFPNQLSALVIDDHDLIRKNIAQVLRKLDFINIIECSNGKKAKIALDSRALDLVICNLNTSAMSGFELLDHLRNLETGSDIPFLIVTGATDRDDIVIAAHKGVEDYMVKPFTQDELEAKIIKVLNLYFAPGPILLRIREAEKLIRHELFENARILLQEAIKIKDNPSAQHLMGLLLIKEKKTDEAISYLQNNIKIYPNFLKNFVSLANIYLEKKDYDNAIKILVQELEINPKQPLRQIKLANLLLKEGQTNAAINHYRIALLENNKNAEGLYGMGTAYALANNLDKSFYYFKRYRRHQPKDSRPLKAMIQFAERSNQTKVAEFALLDEKKSHPDRMDTYHLLADLYFRQDKELLGVSVLESAIKRKPDFESAYIAAIQFYIRRQDAASAIRVMMQFTAITQAPIAYFLLAQLFLQLKKYAQAISTVHRGMEVKLTIEQSYPLLMLATFRTKQLTKAWFIRERLKQVNPHEIIPPPIAQVESLIQDRRHRKSQLHQAS